MQNYELLIQEKLKDNPKFDVEYDELYSHEFERETDDWTIKEELGVFVELVEQTCNMCGKKQHKSVLLHYLKDYTSKREIINDDCVEEDIVLCESCLDKLALLLKEKGED
jgi:DNA-directed RNA polymerase specialized sigma subunit